MDNRTAGGLRILGAAVVVGVAGDALLRGTPWGINVLLLVGIFVMALAALMRSRRLFSGLDGRSLLGVALFFAAGFAWRDSGTLRFLNGLALVVSFALALAALRAWPGQLRIAALTDYALTVGHAGVHAAGGAIPLVFREIGWRRLPGGRWFGPAVAALRGVFIALPILILFGGLFMAADAVFAEAVIDAFD
ncbi:MAG TPA: DUF4153 domain-containing protein [Chloroflexota bacterium]|nr:DUF4153 domain-containing protein [Chloroflexota bacterium]